VERGACKLLFPAFAAGYTKFDGGEQTRPGQGPRKKAGQGSVKRKYDEDCRYMLLIQGKIGARTCRLGTVFDSILELPDENLEAEIKRQLGEAETLLCKLRGGKQGSVG
jgi:hypothetical protein